jgi:hypothetical protein
METRNFELEPPEPQIASSLPCSRNLAHRIMLRTPPYTHGTGFPSPAHRFAPVRQAIAGSHLRVSAGADDLPPELLETIRRAEIAARPDASWNLLKIHTDQFAFTFLSYPDFDTDPHPALAEATKINLKTGTIVRTGSVRGKRNAPPKRGVRLAMLSPARVRSRARQYHAGFQSKLLLAMAERAICSRDVCSWRNRSWAWELIRRDFSEPSSHWSTTRF